MSRQPSQNGRAQILRLTRASLAEGERFLRRRDARLAAWMDRVGPVGLRRQPHHFGTLCRSVLSQQLASKAAATIHGRFIELFAPARRPSPERLLALRDRQLRACGVSAQKAAYLRALARAFHDGDLRGVRLGARSDEDVIERLTQIKGIGRWTAEMFLIFSLGRRDIFSLGDLGLRKGVERVEGRELEPEAIARVASRWAPYRSIASLYLWQIVHWKETT